MRTGTRIVAAAVFLLALATRARADLANPASLTVRETSPSRFTVELTLPLVQGRVLKARPVLPEICEIEGDAEERTDGMKAVRTWTMTCDPDALPGRAIGVRGLLGTTTNVQLTVELRDGRKYLGQLRPTQAYYLIPPPETTGGLAAEFGGAALRQVLRRPELAILFLLGVFLGVGLRGLFASAGAFSVALALGQWLRTEKWIEVSPFLPVMLTAWTAFALAASLSRGKAAATRATWFTVSALTALTGLLSGAGGLPVETVLSRSEQRLAFLFSALGAAAGLVLVILCAGRLRALIAATPVRERLRSGIAFFAGAGACAMALHQATAPFATGTVTPAVPLAVLPGTIVLGAWCGGQPSPVRTFLPAVAGCAVAAGLVLGVRGVALPHTTLALHGSTALVGLLLVRVVRGPGWAVLLLVGVLSLSHGSHAGGVLRGSTVLPVAQATAAGVLLAFLFLATRYLAGVRGPGNAAIRLTGLAALLLALFGRFAEYRDWVAGDLAVEATIGLIRIPVLTVVLLIAALMMRPRRRWFGPPVERKRLPAHWCLVLAALFTVSVAGVRVRSPFHEPRAPTAKEARPVIAHLLADTYLAFNLPDEEAAYDRLAESLSEDLVPGVFLESRRRLTAGTRKGAEVKVKNVRVTAVETAAAAQSGDGSFSYSCKWVVTARVRHWQHVHDRRNAYSGTLTIRVEEDRWKISDLVLLSEEREVLPPKDT